MFGVHFTVAFVVLFTVIVLFLLWVILPLLKKKGVNIDELLDKASRATAELDQTLNTARPILPKVPFVTLVDKIVDYAKVGVGEAEQLYHIGKLPAEQRKEEAKKFIVNALTLIGIAVTSELDKIIDGAIEASVLALGHKSDSKQDVK